MDLRAARSCFKVSSRVEDERAADPTAGDGGRGVAAEDGMTGAVAVDLHPVVQHEPRDLAVTVLGRPEQLVLQQLGRRGVVRRQPGVPRPAGPAPQPV